MKIIELKGHDKKMDALASRILELCEREGVTMFEITMLPTRLERRIKDEIVKQEATTLFHVSDCEFSPTFPE